MEPKEEKLSSTKQTIMLMERPSKFSYYENLDIKLSDQSRILDNATIEKMVLLNEVVASDFFILKALAEMSWANVEMLVAALKAMHKEEPEKAIPDATRDLVKSRVVRLCKASLAKGFEYETASGAPIKVYCATDAGINLIRKKLYYNKSAEIFNALSPCEEVFRRLACNYVAQRISIAPVVTKYIPGGVDYISGVGKVYMYSRLYCEAGESKKVTLFEPIYFRANPLLNSKEEMENFIRSRFLTIKQYSKKAVTDGFQVSIVFVVEDYDGLKNGMLMIMSEMEDWINKIYFTSENAVYAADNVVKSFLKVSKVEDQKPTIMACDKFDFL